MAWIDTLGVIERSNSSSTAKSLLKVQKKVTFHVFFMPLLPSEPFALRQDTGVKNLAGDENYITPNRYWDTGRQLYFNLLGEYTNNQLRLWKRVDAAVFAAAFTAFV